MFKQDKVIPNIVYIITIRLMKHNFDCKFSTLIKSSLDQLNHNSCMLKL